MGFAIGTVLGIFVVLPVGLYVVVHLPVSYFPVAFVGMMVLMMLVIGIGGYFIKRCRFWFRADERVVEVTIIWLIFRRRTQTLPFEAIRSLVIEAGESYTLVMFTASGKRWALKGGTLKKLRDFAEELAGMVGKSTADRMHWS
jgi:hypothetical protein